MKPIKVYLDDMRPAPTGWVMARWPQDAIALMELGGVSEISLDHDLGNDKRGTGYDVLIWIEKAVVTEGFMPPKILIHTGNSAARIRMNAAVQAIKKRVRERSEQGLDID